MNVTLIQMLNAREERVRRQQELLKEHGCPMICFSMNIAGPEKNSPLIRRGFEAGKEMLLRALKAEGITPVYKEEVHSITGNELYLMAECDPFVLKKITSSIEDGYPVGRLFDMDVLQCGGKKIDRESIGFSPRKCLICGKPGKDCARNRSHSVEELQKKIVQILTDRFLKVEAEEAGRLACRALLYEVTTTPKPGLVDRQNTGSHRDMDIFTFIDSACALKPYYMQCMRIGRETSGLKAPETLRRLRHKGKLAEQIMLAQTGGVNTHKGAIFSVGVVCAALGRLPREQWGNAERVLDECCEMSKGLIGADFQDLTEETAVTAGQKLYLKYGITGIRGQMEAGMPAVRKKGLPVLREGIRRGLSINDAGCAALLHIMVSSEDTNIISRSDVETWKSTIEQVKQILKKDPYPDRDTIEALDREFIRKNLSPGGSADLLAITYMLYFLEN